MTIRDFYTEVGGSYDEVMGRMMTEKRICKYLVKFLSVEDYDILMRTVAEQNWTDAFRAVHNLKGVSLNLGLGRLAAASGDLCEEIRHGAPARDITGMVEAVTVEYQSARKAIEALQPEMI